MLFSAAERSDHTPKRATETEFAFLDRCAWPAAERVRHFVAESLEHYPSSEQAELISRIQCGDSRHFASATFELFLHEYLRRLGFELTPHPVLPNGATTRPDFRIRSPAGDYCYLEAVCASDDAGRDLAAEARKALTLQALDAASHPFFMVAVDGEGDPVSQPSGKRLAGDVLRWLDSLDADALLTQAAGGYDTLPEMMWRHEDWSVRIRPIPVNVGARGLSRRLIGIRNFGAGWVDGWTPIRDAVLTKSRRYGDLDLPLVIAVNVDTFNLDPIDEVQALFGQENYVFSVGDAHAEPRFERAPNGAWRGPSGPRGRRCSAAWLFNNLSPYTLARRHQTAYVNPWADRPVPDAILQMPHAVVVDQHIQRRDGKSLREVFGLSEAWPE